MKLPFLGQAYASRSPILGSQTAINIFPELAESGGDEVGAFYGTPGLTSVYQASLSLSYGSGQVRGLKSTGTYLIAVIGNTVYKFSSSWTPTVMGTLTTSTGRVSIVANDTQFAVADSVGMTGGLLSGSSIASITNGPGSAVLSEQDNYVLFSANSGGQFGITALADLTTIDPLDIATAEGAPDNLVSLICDHRDVWLFGDTSTEVWTNTGAALFPFERAPGGFIEQGCAAKWSPAKIDNSVFWLGKDVNGKGVVYRNNGYLPMRISTHPIEYAINGYSDISDAIGFAYQEEGHAFYVLTFPTGNETWVYDVSTKAWHQRAFLEYDGTLTRHRANCYAFHNGQHLIGDYTNGKIYRMSLDTYTDDGEEIYRERAFELPDSDGKRIRMNRLQLDAIVADGATATDSTPAKVWLQISRDYGQSWGYQRVRNLGALGQTRARCVWRNLGMGRNIVLRVGTTMANRVHWLSAKMDAEGLSV